MDFVHANTLPSLIGICRRFHFFAQSSLATGVGPKKRHEFRLFGAASVANSNAIARKLNGWTTP